MEPEGLRLLVEAILAIERRKNLSAVRRKISKQQQTEVERMRRMLKREKATPPPKRYIRGSMKAKKLSRFIFEEIVVPDVPQE